MATFAYSGRTRAGQTVSGERVADTMDGATAALRREQINVTKITPVQAKADAKAEKKGKIGKKVSAKNLAVFTRQFSVMIDAGLPLVQCLDILGTQEEDKNFAAVILQTRTDVESGASLADAMRRHPKTFDPLFTNMIAAGEAGGILDTILKRLATYIEKAVKLAGQVKSAMVYPIAVICIAGIVVEYRRNPGHIIAAARYRPEFERTVRKIELAADERTVVLDYRNIVCIHVAASGGAALRGGCVGERLILRACVLGAPRGLFGGVVGLRVAAPRRPPPERQKALP